MHTDAILAGHSVILNMLVFAKYFSDVPFYPWLFGSDSCEVLFSYLRGFTKGKNNFKLLEMLDITARVIKLLELKYRNKHQDTYENTAWPHNLGLGQTSNPSCVEYIKNRCDKESTSFQRGSKRRTCVDPISQVPLH